MFFDSEECIARREELEKMEEKAMFEHTVNRELEHPGSTRVSLFSNPEKAQILRKAIETASDIRSRTGNDPSESSGAWTTDRERVVGGGGKVGKILIKWGLIGLLVIIGIKMIVPENIVKEMPTRVDSGRQYAAAYDFSKVTGPVDSKEFVVPAGDKPVLVALPANYRVTFSSATAKAGELDRLDGTGPTPFGEQTDFGKKSGKEPMAVAIKVPEGCTMTASFVHH
ncbi:hypothetical protein A2532_00850 [Candidatus Wolfebacteria bacterium RIFOXYD2_FULL_48_11]|uniref:Uncharacterized protein n=1 Tax=Candidatus Wolfebacteria bacterium RIFOXYD1_FULL_48_65 TaxID=1802561 RepID=A0A1F8DYM4_9BACT|nr:MAG: hypothetical protein A2610_00100 [Candidatus Wolfebacteria bacterium RIFOXYD1_FULL_48_65]OGM96457.1 MAG: hypothetical protein A2532_00850 [Candidatus Wolfebacteria bacterium RIFOXYD2_FULL_48_11]